MEDASSLASIAQHADPDKVNREGRIQKTFVISRKSLSLLDTISKNFGTSRDDLVECSVQRLLPIIIKERQKQHQRKVLSLRFAEHLNEGKALLDEIKKQLGKDDLIYNAMDTAIGAYKKAYSAIGSFIQKGKRIEDFPMEKFNEI